MLGSYRSFVVRLEGRVTTAVRLDASCVRPQRQERHNVVRSICRSSFAGLGMIRLVLCAQGAHILSHVGFYKGRKLAFARKIPPTLRGLVRFDVENCLSHQHATAGSQLSIRSPGL